MHILPMQITSQQQRDSQIVSERAHEHFVKTIYFIGLFKAYSVVGMCVCVGGFEFGLLHIALK